MTSIDIESTSAERSAAILKKNQGKVNSRRPMVLHARVVTSTGGGPDKTIINSPRFLNELGFDCVCGFFIHRAMMGLTSSASVHCKQVQSSWRSRTEERSIFQCSGRRFDCVASEAVDIGMPTTTRPT